jgi:hypothetical protein
MGLHAPRQREAQGGQLLAQASFGQLSQDGGIGFSLLDGPPHAAPADAHHIARHGTQFAMGRLQYFVDPIDLLGTQLHERLPLAGEIAQDADGLRREKTGA